jgi:hypothetical protein
MRFLLLTAVAAIFLAYFEIGGRALPVTRAATPAALCFDTPCMSSSFCGGQGCVCIKRPLDVQGYCASIDAKPEGAVVLP